MKILIKIITLLVQIYQPSREKVLAIAKITHFPFIDSITFCREALLASINNSNI
ncbi:MAG: hypothetical protein F6K36_09730 [Symploca sp. SIO3C6]|uniref:Uncharacterized protein n=1 Tax=Symploca sp. SIO1C4 TaxID=2607765 RepID=A0A6B3NIS3_9CYAN|nr:hypothetical protein [Symploca sp. SIO3C6]NER29964.1 hypothetical protein [Symploca sp. SIO1C4]NET04828.1 hypothetical protein [Symploca sp. SIO2B6]